MTDNEKRELKDDVISIFKRFNILDHTATIGGLRDDILRYIDFMQEEPVSENLNKAAGNYAFTMSGEDEVSKYYAFLAGAKWQRQQDEHLIWQISSANYEKGKQEAREEMIHEFNLKEE